MRYAILVLAVFAARFLATAISYPQGDADIEWQRWLGKTILKTGHIPKSLGPETFSAQGAYWLPQEWLFSIAASLAHGAWWPIFAGFVALCPLVAILFVGLRARAQGSSESATALVVAAAGVAVLESFGVRVQVVAWPLFVIFLYLIEREDKYAYAAIAVAALWSNVHASVMLAPTLGLIMTTGQFLDEGWGRQTKKTLLISIGSLVATCANPFGWELPIYAIHLFSSPFKDLISEWRHTTITEEAFLYAALPMLLVFASFGIKGKHAWRDRAIMGATTVLMLSAARNIAIFALATAPYVAATLSQSISWLRNQANVVDEKSNRIILQTMPIVAIILFSIVTYGLLNSDSRTEDDRPHKAIAFIEAQPGTHKVFCADFSWCAFLVASEHNAVYLDSRADPYPNDIWEKYKKIVRLKFGWSKTLDETHANIVIAGINSAFESGIELTPKWHSIYKDKKYNVWTNRP